MSAMFGFDHLGSSGFAKNWQGMEKRGGEVYVCDFVVLPREDSSLEAIVWSTSCLALFVENTSDYIRV